MKNSSRRSFLTSSLAAAAVSGLTGVAQDVATRPTLVKPARLKKGDRIGLINPAGATAHRVDVEIVRESLAALGFEVQVAGHVLDRYGYLAGSDSDRAADVMAQFEDPSVAGIVAIRGGWGCARILPLLNFDVIGRNPKVLLGYSDVTALLLAVHARTGIVTFHGPVGSGSWNQFTAGYFRRVVMDGDAVEYRNPKQTGGLLTQVYDRVETIVEGKASGRLLGGNLTVLSAIVGSPFLPDWQGAILFLEDVGEDIYRVDRMLTQLRLAGILDQIEGFIFGKCTECGPGEGYGSLTLEQVFDDHIKPLGKPAWQGAMIGHISDKFTLPEGIPVEIDAGDGTIRLLEAAVI